MLGFLLKYWKYIAIVLAVISLVGGSIFWYQSQISAAEDRGFIRGEQAERTIWEERVAAENEANRQLEENLTSALETSLQRFIDETGIRVVKEETIIREVETIINENPIYEQCLIDQEVLDARNAIRALGPPPEDVPTSLGGDDG